MAHLDFIIDATHILSDSQLSRMGELVSAAHPDSVYM